MTKLVITIPGLKLPSPNQLNTMGWRKRGKVKGAVKDTVFWHCKAALRGRDDKPMKIVVSRLSSGTLDDDNAIASAKNALDAIASAIGVDDKKFAVRRWDAEVFVDVLQERVAHGGEGVRVELYFGGVE